MESSPLDAATESRNFGSASSKPLSFGMSLRRISSGMNLAAFIMFSHSCASLLRLVLRLM